MDFTIGPYTKTVEIPVVHYIYKIEMKITHQCYIGQTKNPQRRMEQHCTGEGSPHLLAAMMQYGINSFTFSIIHCTSDSSIIDALEDKYIIEHDAIDNGFNCMLNREPEIVQVDTSDIKIQAKYMNIDTFTIGKKSLYKSYELMNSLDNCNVFQESYKGHQYLKVYIRGIDTDDDSENLVKGEIYNLHMRVNKDGDFEII